MPAKQLPGQRLWAEWDVGESGWKTGMDNNLRLLSAATQPRLAVSSGPLPESGVSTNDLAWDESDGKLKYAVVSPDPPYTVSWVVSPVQPAVGWWFYDRSLGAHVAFDGTEMYEASIREAPRDGRPYVRMDGGWIVHDYLISSFIPVISGLDLVLAAFILPAKMTLQAGAVGCVARAQAPGLDDTKLHLCKNGVPFGELDFATGQGVGVFTVSSDVEFAKHDEISVLSDDSIPGVAEGITILLRLIM